MDLDHCCGRGIKWTVKTVQNVPYIRRIGFNVCPNCGMPRLFDFRIYAPGQEIRKPYFGKAAIKQYNKWQRILNNGRQGTLSKQYFYYGEFQQCKNGYFKTYRKNFNNEKEFLFKGKVKII